MIKLMYQCELVENQGDEINETAATPNYDDLPPNDQALQESRSSIFSNYNAFESISLLSGIIPGTKIIEP